MRNTLLVALTVSVSAGTALADDVDLTAQRVSVEADALPYVMGGFDVVLGYQPAALPRARVIASTHSFELPGALLPDDWHSHTRAVTLHGQWFSRAGGRGFMFGAQLAYSRFDVIRESMPGAEVSYDTFEVAGFAGYRWFPFGTGLFVTAWGKVGVPVKVRGESMLGGEKVPSRPISVYPSVHLGYEVQL
jgi:hypothetical protein